MYSWCVPTKGITIEEQLQCSFQFTPILYITMTNIISLFMLLCSNDSIHWINSCSFPNSRNWLHRTPTKLNPLQTSTRTWEPNPPPTRVIQKWNQLPAVQRVTRTMSWLTCWSKHLMNWSPVDQLAYAYGKMRQLRACYTMPTSWIGHTFRFILLL